ncbi:MAG TPA: hypothetical protein VHO69_02470 [Phototrophicaceae bacterium]|nr:hypothetical protein [Phototrophicaceae bacterium]
MTNTQPLSPIMTIDLLAEMRAALVTLLWSLTPEEWERPTLCCPG